MQNTINCGKWFYHAGRTYTPSSSFNRSNEQSQSYTIPAFVQPGYEEFFLNRSGQILNYTSEGYPTVIKPPKNVLPGKNKLFRRQQGTGALGRYKDQQQRGRLHRGGEPDMNLADRIAAAQELRNRARQQQRGGFTPQQPRRVQG